jgi:hypothetical protein
MEVSDHLNTQANLYQGKGDYHVFGVLKLEALWEQRFASDEVKNVVHMCLQSPSHAFFAFGIGRLVNCYTICVEKQE